MDKQQHIRNFAIIAHIDHGKSTLADRLMEVTGTVEHRDMQAQLLDSNPIERERGITIKLAPVRMLYTMHNEELIMHNDGKKEDKDSSIIHSTLYILNLIDTPGHVDFGYEVSRSLAACEGAILVVDATQGVQAQTLANLHQARMNNLTVIPVINKIDIPHAQIAETRQELCALGFTNEEILEISAKNGIGIEKVLEAIIKRIPSPKGNADAPTRALIFSSQYDQHKGVVVFMRIVDGHIPFDPQVKIRLLATNMEIQPIGVGYFNPKMVSAPDLETGEVGYIATGLKDVKLAKVGDTITTESVQKSSAQPTTRHAQTLQPLPGYKEPKPMVFVGLFPIEQEEFTKSRVAMEKLRLSDSAFTFRPISSMALGNGFHCGFLGLLHAEVVQERLTREFDLSLLATAPSVEYLVRLKPGVNAAKAGLIHSSLFLDPSEEKISMNPAATKALTGKQELGTTNYYSIQSASEFPDPTVLEEVKEPMMQVTIFSPKRFVGPIMQLSEEKRGEYADLVYHGEQAEFTYLIPLSEMIVDFFDRLKSVTEGYASLDYEFYDFQTVDAIKVDILVNHEKIDALSFLIVKDHARTRGKEIVERLAEVLPRQQFNIPVQAAIGGEVIARGDIKPFRKDVIQKLYGGDRTRKDKLLKKQKKGKAKMKLVGSVEIPQTAFFDVLRNR